MSKLVSIIMPNYNGEATLRRAILSVVGQTYKNWELIVVDDCSTDNSRNLISAFADKDPRVKPIFLEKNSKTAAVPRNRGLDRAQGDFIAFLDSDDEWLPEKLKRQLDFMVRERCDFSFHSFLRVFEGGPFEGRATLESFGWNSLNYTQLLCGNPIACSTVVVGRELISGERFDAQMRLHEDYAMWLKLLKKIRYAGFLSEPLARYSVRDGAFSGNKWRAAKQQWSIYRNYEKLPIHRAAYCFTQYAFKGFFKHKVRPIFAKG